MIGQNKSIFWTGDNSFSKKVSALIRNNLPTSIFLKVDNIGVSCARLFEWVEIYRRYIFTPHYYKRFIERFEQIRQTEAASDQTYLLANASQTDLPAQVPMRNFTTINPSDLRDKENTDFWKNDRITREAHGDLERAHSVSSEESRLLSEREPDEEEMSDGGETFDIGQAGLSQ